MNEKVIPFLRHKRQAMREVKAKLDSFQYRQAVVQKTQIYTLQDICDEVHNILKQEKYITDKDLECLTKFNCLNHVLTFFKQLSERFRKGQSSKENPESKTICYEVLSQKRELKQKLQQKNRTILKLNEGYFEAKQYFEKQLFIKESVIKDLKKDIFSLTSQKQILKQKVEILLNFREAAMKQAFGHQKSEAMNRQSSEDQRPKITQSQKSSYHDIKDMLSFLETKTESRQSCINILRRSRSRMQQSIQSEPLTETKGKSSLTLKKSPNKNSSQEIQDKSASLMNQIAILRQNQSHLLDRICERDHMITELLKVKGKNFQSSNVI